MNRALQKIWTVAAVVLLLMCGVLSASANDGIPARPHPPRLVNDMAGLFSEATRAELEDSLRRLSNTTSNQIVIVTVDDLNGFTPNQFATEIGDRWGVGQKKEDNGVVILIKPKTGLSKGQVYIATGRGLEGALPDVFCNRIVHDRMLPKLKHGNDYTAATWAALEVIMPVCRGEYNYETYKDDEKVSLGVGIVVGIILLLLFGIRGFFLPFGSFTSGRSSGFGGGWGGFGGGSFGGGGAGGSW
ncbi:MAG: TPM domain-containing protein [Sodaliphilus sp.]